MCEEGRLPPGGSLAEFGKMGEAEGQGIRTEGRVYPRAWRRGIVGNSVDGKV